MLQAYVSLLTLNTVALAFFFAFTENKPVRIVLMLSAGSLLGVGLVYFLFWILFIGPRGSSESDGTQAGGEPADSEAPSLSE